MSDHLQNPSLWHSSWPNKACTTRKDSESEWLAKDNRETNPIPIKPETASHVTELFSWVPLPYCFPPGCPFPIKSLALSADVSPRTIYFRVLDKSLVSSPGRGPSSFNKEPSFRPWKGSPFLQHIFSHNSQWIIDVTICFPTESCVGISP